MRRLNHLSIALVAIGIATCVLAWLTPMGTTWLLIGVLVAFTGVVKASMVVIWTRIAHMGTDQHRPIDHA